MINRVAAVRLSSFLQGRSVGRRHSPPFSPTLSRTSQKVLFLFEQRFQFRAGVARGGGLSRLPVFGEGKILTEVSGFFVEHLVRVGLTAGVGVVGIVKQAIQATVQISAAAWTGIASTNAVEEVECSLATMAGVHSSPLLITPLPRHCPLQPLSSPEPYWYDDFP